MPSPRSRNWCFTIWLHDENNELVNEEKLLLANDEFKPIEISIPKAAYCVYQYEMVDNLHIQGYVRFDHARSMSGLRKVLEKWSNEKGPHLEVAKGTPLENKEYCTKVDTRKFGPYEFGEVPSEDELPIMSQAFQILKDNKGIVNEQLMTPKFINHTTMYCSKWKTILTDIENVNWIQRTEYQKPKVFVLYGKTGTGKSRRAYANGAVEISIHSQWPFNEYRGEPVVVFDDFRGEIAVGNLIKLLDGHPRKVPIQYSGNKPWIPKRIYITSNEHPKEWYPKLSIDKPNTYAALLRRFDIIDYYDVFRPAGNTDLDNDDPISQILIQPEHPQVVDIPDIEILV